MTRGPVAMASLTIRKLDEDTKSQLRLQAARHGRSMEEEARTILREALAMPNQAISGPGLGSRIHSHFSALGGVVLDLPERQSAAEPATFGDETGSGESS